MAENEQKGNKPGDLAAAVKEKLQGTSENFDDILDEDPIVLMKKNARLSMALSSYMIERTLKGMLYLMNVGADSGLSYNRDYFYAIFGGEDPELIEKAEIARLNKLDADAAAEQEAAAKANKVRGNKVAKEPEEKVVPSDGLEPPPIPGKSFFTKANPAPPPPGSKGGKNQNKKKS